MRSPGTPAPHRSPGAEQAKGSGVTGEKPFQPVAATGHTLAGTQRQTAGGSACLSSNERVGGGTADAQIGTCFCGTHWAYTGGGTQGQPSAHLVSTLCTHTHVSTHTATHPHVQTYTRVCPHRCIDTRTHICVHTPMCIYTATHSHVQTHRLTRVRTLPRAPTATHMCTHPHTPLRHSHVHTCLLTRLCSHACPHTLKHTRAHAHTCTHVLMSTHLRVRTRALVCARAHACTHIRVCGSLTSVNARAFSVTVRSHVPPATHVHPDTRAAAPQSGLQGSVLPQAFCDQGSGAAPRPLGGCPPPAGSHLPHVPRSPTPPNLL